MSIFVQAADIKIGDHVERQFLGHDVQHGHDLDHR